MARRFESVGEQTVGKIRTRGHKPNDESRSERNEAKRREVNEADELNKETEGERRERVSRFGGTSQTGSEGGG
jgi:hypothetical protein